MIDLKGTPGELHFTIEVTRAATGKVETYDLIGKILPEEPENSDNDTKTEEGK